MSLNFINFKIIQVKDKLNILLILQAKIVLIYLK